MRLFPAAAAMFSILVTTFVAGCQSRQGGSQFQTRMGPHGNVAIPLPEGLGYVEARVESPAGGDPEKGKPAVLAVYFLGPDGKAELAPPPSNVRLRLATDQRKYEAVALGAGAKPGDPLGNVRFATEPGSYSKDSSRGWLLISLGGKDVAIPFVLR